MIRICLLASILLTIACNGTKKTYSMADDTAERLGLTPVSVKNFEGLDGCSWMLVAKDSTRYEVVQFPDSLKNESLRLWIRFKPANDYMSICMGGMPIRLTETHYQK